MKKPRKSRLRKSQSKHPCGCFYCVGTTYKEWLNKKYKHLKTKTEDE